MSTKFVYFHQHPGFSKELIENQILAMNLHDGVHKVVVKNDHKELCTCVSVPMFDDRVFWAFRGSRTYPSPMISKEDAMEVGLQETDDVTVVFKKKGGLYRVITCYAGAGSPKEPSTAKSWEYEDSVEYWSNHALVPDEDYRCVESLDDMPHWVIDSYIERYQ